MHCIGDTVQVSPETIEMAERLDIAYAQFLQNQVVAFTTRVVLQPEVVGTPGGKFFIH